MKFFTSVFYIHRIGWPIIESVLCVLGDRKLLGWDNYNNNNGRHELHTDLHPAELHLSYTDLWKRRRDKNHGGELRIRMVVRSAFFHTVFCSVGTYRAAL